MSTPAAQLVELSRLLDAALDLPSDQVKPWLDALPPAQQHLRPQLQEMLERQRATAHAAFLSDGPRLDGVDPSAPRAGERVGPYVLIRELGQGGMATVWLAARADGTLKRQVALKLPRLAWGAGLAKRMARERDILARLEHANIARLYDAGVDEQGRPYLALEFIDGQPIDAWCEARALPLRERLALIVQVANAVGFAHGSLVVHRDLKPSNILVTPDGQVHLLDFGIAKLLESTDGPDGDVTQTQARLLTPRYASPEQAEGRPVTVASDVYSLGVVLHQLLTGRLPALPSPHEDAAPASRCVTDRSVARTLRGDLDAIVGKALRHDPARRYETIQAFANDLENHLADRPVQARPDSALYIAGRFARLHWLGLSAVTAVCAAIVVGGATAIVQARHAEREAERARAATEFVAELFRLNSGETSATDSVPTSTAFIDRGASLIQTRFAGKPEMQAELLGAVGRAYNDMGANALAADYANRRIQVLQQLPDTRREQVESLLLASNSYVQDEDDEAAEATARRAIELSGTELQLRLDSLAALARAQFDSGSIALARLTIQSAQSLVRATPQSEDSAAAAHILCVQAMLLTLDEDLKESRSETEKAVAAALRTEGSGSRTAEDLLFTRALALLRRGLFDEARPTFEQAMSVLHQKHSGLASVREAVRTADFWAMASEKATMPFQDTLATVRANRDKLQALGNDIPPVLRARTDFALGAMYMDSGDISQAVRWLEPSIAVLQRSKPNMRWRMTLLGVRAYMDRLRGKDAEALAAHLESLELTKQLYGSNSARAVLSYAWLATELVWQAQFDRAEQVLNEAERIAKPTKGSQAALRIARARIGIALGRGDIRQAKELLPPMEADITVLNWRLMAIRSRVQCSSGDSIGGLATMRAIRYELAKDSYIYDPDLAMLRSQTGLCALTIGQRSLAMECANEARRAFDEQPLIGPRYKEPLLKLEQALNLALGTPHSTEASGVKLANAETC